MTELHIGTGSDTTTLPLGSGQQGNQYLALLQVATAQRFSTGEGYFFTASGTVTDDEPVHIAIWLHPSIPLRFVYDLKDDTDNRIPPVLVEDALVDALLAQMGSPAGVRYGYDDENGRHGPF